MTRPLPDGLVQAAIGWSIRLDYNEPSERDRQAFERWLQADPLHGLAWQRVSGLKGFEAELRGLPPGLARAALQTAQDLRARERAAGRRTAVKLLSGAGLAVATAWLAREQGLWQRLLADASTGIGEQRSLSLADGSTVMLNTDSAISIDFDGDSRLIQLRRGEILVNTGPDSEAVARSGGKRPFWVLTPFGRIQALGTRFTARLGDGHARISVQEAAVVLHPADGGGAGILSEGESCQLMKDGMQPAEPQGFTADGWAEGVIAGRNIRLGDLLSELERYRPGRIVCDPDVAGLRVSGLFHVKDTDRALQFLAQTQPVRIGYRTRWWVTVGPG